MRLTIWLALIPLAGTTVVAQHGSFGRSGSGHSRVIPNTAVQPFAVPPQRGMQLGIPPVQPIPPLGPAFPGTPPLGRASRPSWFFPFPVVGSYQPALPTVQNVIVVAQPTPAPAPDPPPRTDPARSSIHEYDWTAKDASQITGQTPAFTLVLEDGSVHLARAVWVQDDVVRYVDTEGRHNRLPLAAVDRQATERMNRARQLNLQLPPPNRRD